MRNEKRHTNRTYGFVRAVVVLVAAGLLGAACGGAIPSSQGGSTTIKLGSSKLGRFLVDEGGHSLYLFARDEPKESYCDGACASVWPPVETEGNVSAAVGVAKSRLGTIKRDDGDLQVTFDGHPLYYYAGDASKAGETYGEGIDQFGAEWYLVSPAGKAVEAEHEQGGGSGGSGDQNRNGGGGGY